MPIITAPDLTLLRSKNHKSKVFASILRPLELWSAVINDSGIGRGETNILFDGGSGLDFSAIQAGQEVFVGFGVGNDQIGRLRIRSIVSGDGGATGTLTVARNALDFLDNANLTFYQNYPLLPKYPLITGPPSSAVFLKDGDITYTNQNEDTAPVVIAGENRANFINSTLGYWEIESQLPDSYVTAGGATITTYGATVYPTTGVTISINAGTGVGFIRFATPGIYWVRWSITDSNGTNQISYRWYYTHSNDPTDTHYPFISFGITQISGDWNRGGWETGITVHDNADLESIPDKTGIILWQQTSYDGTVQNITFLPDNSNTIVSGYVRKEKIEEDISNELGDVDFQIVTLDAVLRNHYMFSVSLASRETPTEWYEYNPDLNIPQAIHHFWRWHSTLFEIADVFLGDNVLGRAYAEIEDGNLYSMVDDLARNKGIRAHVVCDKGNRVHLCYDIQLLTDAERVFLPVVQEIEYLDRSGDMVLMREPYNRTAFVKTSGFTFDGTFAASGCPDPPCPNVTPICSSAPGEMPSDEGSNIVDFDRQVFTDQGHCDAIAGRFFAQINNRYPELRISFHGNYLGVLDVAYPEFWQISLSATDSAREIVWVDKNLICRTVTAQINTQGNIITCSAAFEPEQEASAGVAGYCLYELPDIPGDPGDIDIPPQPSGGFGTFYGMTADVLARTRDLSVASPAYVSIKTAGLTEDFYDWILDPFDPIHNGFLLMNDGVYRSTDLDQTVPTFTQVLSKAQMATLTGSPAGNILQYYKIGATIKKEGFLAFGAWDRNTGPSTYANVWVFVSEDGGDTWSAHVAFNITAGSIGSSSVYTGAMDISQSELGPGGDPIIGLVCGHDGLQRFMLSETGGQTWVQKSVGWSLGGGGNADFSDVHFPYNTNSDTTKVLIAAWSTGTLTYTYFISTDQGATWTPITEAGLSGNVNAAFNRNPFQSWTNNYQELYAFGTGGAGALSGFYRTNDFGSSWVQKTDLNGNARAAGGFPYNNEQFYVMTPNGILVTIDDGTTWVNKTGDWAWGFSFIANCGGVVVPQWLE